MGILYYLQALAVPTIAFFGVWIAARQMRIADKKLQLDAFDRQYEKRFAVYVATRKFIGDVYLGNISEDEIKVYGLLTLDAKFLFDDKVYRELKEIRDRGHALHDARLKAKSESGEDEKRAFQSIADEQRNWFTQQGDDFAGFDVKFKQFLVYRPVKRPWLLRWP
jgi:hypothetical protein